MRVYLPATVVDLQGLADTGALARPGVDALTGFAVTAGLRQWYGEDTAPHDDPTDEEDLEYAATAEAARAALRLLDAAAAGLLRRVVIAAEVTADRVAVRDDLDRGVVRVGSPVALTEVTALFVDDADAAPTVQRAAAAIDAADLGDAVAQDAVDDAEGFELSWYAPQELDAVLARVAAAD